MNTEILNEILNGLRAINKNLVEIKEIQKNSHVEELMNPNGHLLTTINALVAQLQKTK